jgi:hypothetical protein
MMLRLLATSPKTTKDAPSVPTASKVKSRTKPSTNPRGEKSVVVLHELCLFAVVKKRQKSSHLPGFGKEWEHMRLCNHPNV